MNIVILAAGSGKRMRSNTPKVLHLLGGKPLLAHVISTARKLLPDRIIVVIGRDNEKIKQSISSDDISFIEQSQQLGTGHALLQAVPLLDLKKPTIVLYGDVPMVESSTLDSLVKCAAVAGGPYGFGYGILTAHLPDPTGYGRIVRDKNGEVRSIVEHEEASIEELSIKEINTGIIVTPTLPISNWLKKLKNFNQQGEFYLTDVMQFAAHESVPIVTVFSKNIDETIGVNNAFQLAQLERIYQMRQAKILLESGVSLRDPTRFDIRGELICGNDVIIDVNNVFEGRVELDDRVSIGPNCFLCDVKVGADTRIDGFSHIKMANIGARSLIGPYTRLRPGTRIADEVHIGNFVEIKESNIDFGSKVNHMSYIGNASVGRNVNIGAGTITCNYDGANKHSTVIEDRVFIGSDTQLIAPINIGQDTTIAAGTTLWKDVGPRNLVLNRKTQITKSGYERSIKKKN